MKDSYHFIFQIVVRPVQTWRNHVFSASCASNTRKSANNRSDILAVDCRPRALQVLKVSYDRERNIMISYMINMHVTESQKMDCMLQCYNERSKISRKYKRLQNIFATKVKAKVTSYTSRKKKKRKRLKMEFISVEILRDRITKKWRNHLFSGDNFGLPEKFSWRH